jgi:hypothetical protein
MTSTDRLGSKLVYLGLLLMGLGIIVPNQLEGLLRTGHHQITLPLALTIDGFKVGFFLGLAALIIGLLRNRKSKRDEGPSA